MELMDWLLLVEMVQLGEHTLARKGINTVAIPATIDLDVGFTDYTIGFDTAVNTAMMTIDRVRDTSASHERCSIIEVMGRSAGHIALWCGICTGAEDILIKERYTDDEVRIIDKINMRRKTGRKHYIIINAEGIGDSYGLAERIEEATGMEARATIIGYAQRGGNPTSRDRYYGTSMGGRAVDLLCSGTYNRVIAYRNGVIEHYDIEKALLQDKGIDDYMYDLAYRI